MFCFSYESGVLEDPASHAPDNLYMMTDSPEKAPDKATILDIEFKNGLHFFSFFFFLLNLKPLKSFSATDKIIFFAKGIARDQTVPNMQFYLGSSDTL